MHANVNANRAEYNTLVALDAVVGLTAIIGGLALLVGWIHPPIDVLRGSPFPNYVVPGLALLIVVGGTATMASIAVLARRKFGIAVVQSKNAPAPASSRHTAVTRGKAVCLMSTV